MMTPHFSRIPNAMTPTRCFRLLILPLAAAFAWFWAAGAMAQEGQEDLGTFKDWYARKFKEKGSDVCTMFSLPVKSEGDYTQRGDVYAFVTHRQTARRINEVSVKIGYTFKTETPVVVRIGQAEFELFSEDDFAWAEDSAEDEKLVRAMRGGATMVVEGISSRGTRTVDTFSLSGFSAAHNKITEACKVR